MKRILEYGRSGWPSLALVAGYCVAAWWPFAPWPRNHTSWLPERAGLHFTDSAIAYDAEPLPGTGHAGLSNQTANFTVELSVEADRVPANNVFNLMTIHDGRLPSNFVLCQWKKELLLRIPRQNPPPGSRRTREAGANGALEMQRTHFVTITGSAAGTDFYLDGVRSGHYPEFVLRAEAFKGRLILGNAANGKHSWAGRLYGLAIYDRALEAAEVAQNRALWLQGQARQLTNAPGLMALYLFDEASGQRAKDLSGHRHTILIPTTYDPPQKEFLIPPTWDFVSQNADHRDIVANVLGFIPFGFCYLVHRRSSAPGKGLRNAFFVVCAGAVVSLGLETLQVWLPNRVSSMTDLICNTAGTLLGVLLALVIVCVVRLADRRSNPIR